MRRDLRLGLVVVSHLEVPSPVQAILLDVGQHEHHPRGSARSGEPCRGQKPVVAMVVVDTKPDLLQVVRTADAVGTLSYFLNCRQQQGDQLGNDGDDYQQLNQGEAGGRLGRGLRIGISLFARCQ